MFKHFFDLMNLYFLSILVWSTAKKSIKILVIKLSVQADDYNHCVFQVLVSVGGLLKMTPAQTQLLRTKVSYIYAPCKTLEFMNFIILFDKYFIYHQLIFWLLCF